jgi:probable HAF family extracellular repeat protein
VVVQSHGFYLNGDTYTSFDPPGSVATTVVGVNNSGEIVGSYLDGNNETHGFLFNAGVFTIVDFPGARLTVINGVNDLGQIVGYAETGNVIENFIGSPQ